MRDIHETTECDMLPTEFPFVYEYLFRIFDFFRIPLFDIVHMVTVRIARKTCEVPLIVNPVTIL